MIKPRFDGKRFSYPSNMDMGSRWDALRWAISRKPVKWPRDLSNPPATPVMQRISNNGLRITFINHATVLIQCDGVNIITDPVFSKRVSPVSFAGPRRYRPAGLDFDELPKIDAVLISHTHYDHLDLRTLRRLCERDNPDIVAPLNNGNIIDGVASKTTTELSWWDTHKLSDDVTVSLVPERHWTSRKPGDENQCLWGGFVASFASGKVYFAGDTGYGDGEHFRAAHEQFGAFRCALIPIGAYEPRWFMQPQHMNPAEAVKAFRDLGAPHSLGIHHGTFQLTDEGHDQPVIDLQAALQEADIEAGRFITLPNGGAWDVPQIVTS